jgi:hypothetical protein
MEPHLTTLATLSSINSRLRQRNIFQEYMQQQQIMDDPHLNGLPVMLKRSVIKERRQQTFAQLSNKKQILPPLSLVEHQKRRSIDLPVLTK